MRRPILCVVALTSLTVVLCGCGRDRNTGTQQHVGVYIKHGNPSEFIELKSDGSYVSSERGVTLNGTYEIDGARLTLECPEAGQSSGRLDGDKIIDNENQTWVKTEPGTQNKPSGGDSLTRASPARWAIFPEKW